MCILQPDPGNCRGSFQRYYFNMNTRKCERFIYGGCGGNGNRFDYVSSCEDACLSSGWHVTCQFLYKGQFLNRTNS